MYWIHFVVTVFLFQSSIGLSIPRSRRQQASGSLYGNSNPSPGFNSNFYGTNLNNNNNNNNQAAKDLYGNPLVPGNTGVGLNNMGLSNQQQQQQQQQQPQQAQIYGPNGQPLANPPYGVGNAYQPSGTNQVNTNLGLRDANGNPLQQGQGAPSSSLYSQSNPHLNYPGNANQGLLNKDSYNPAANPNANANANNNNQYPYGSTYNGQQVPQNANSNLWPNNNNNNNNNNNQYNPNLWNQNRQLNPNTNNNNNNQGYTNPNSQYFYNANSACPLFNSFSMFILSFIAIIFFHIY